MPGSVANAVATQVLPEPIARVFSRRRDWSVRSVEYRDGRSQRETDFATSRKSWEITRRLTAADLATLRTFYEARNGPHEAFIFYDAEERQEEGSNPIYDETGVATGAGKYVVRFTNAAWTQRNGLGRQETTFGLIEVT